MISIIFLYLFALSASASLTPDDPQCATLPVSLQNDLVAKILCCSNGDRYVTPRYLHYIAAENSCQKINDLKFNCVDATGEQNITEVECHAGDSVDTPTGLDVLTGVTGDFVTSLIEAEDSTGFQFLDESVDESSSTASDDVTDVSTPHLPSIQSNDNLLSTSVASLSIDSSIKGCMYPTSVSLSFLADSSSTEQELSTQPLSINPMPVSATNDEQIQTFTFGRPSDSGVIFLTFNAPIARYFPKSKNQTLRIDTPKTVHNVSVDVNEGQSENLEFVPIDTNAQQCGSPFEIKLQSPIVNQGGNSTKCLSPSSVVVSYRTRSGATVTLAKQLLDASPQYDYGRPKEAGILIIGFDEPVARVFPRSDTTPQRVTQPSLIYNIALGVNQGKPENFRFGTLDSNGQVCGMQFEIVLKSEVGKEVPLAGNSTTITGLSIIGSGIANQSGATAGIIQGLQPSGHAGVSTGVDAFYLKTGAVGTVISGNVNGNTGASSSVKTIQVGFAAVAVIITAVVAL